MDDCAAGHSPPVTFAHQEMRLTRWYPLMKWFPDPVSAYGGVRPGSPYR